MEGESHGWPGRSSAVSISTTTAKILPEAIPVNRVFVVPSMQPPDAFQAVISLPDDETRGQYGGVYDCRCRVFDPKLGKLNYWAMLFWNRIIMTVQFHHPRSCQCEDCGTAVADMEVRAADVVA